MQEARQWAQSMVDLTVDRLKSVFPLQTDDNTIELKDIDRIDTDKHVYDYDGQKKSMLNEIDFTVPIKGTVVVKDKSGKVISEHKSTLLDLPALTARGTFIIGGKDYSIKHQLRRKPGVYTHVKENGELESEMLVKGANYKINLDPKTGLFTVDIRGKSRPLYSMLKALNITDAEIIKQWGDRLYKINSEKFKDKHIEDLKSIVGADDLVDHFRQHKVDYGVMKATLGKYNEGQGQTYITPQTFLQTSKKLLEVSKDEEEPDERDSLNFKSFTPANKIFAQYVDNTANIVTEGIKKNIRRGIVEAKDIVNTGYANSAIRKFFSLDLVNAAERTNPIAIASAPKKVTLLGTGAIDDENKVPNESRDIHPTQIGFIDPVQTPAGNAGVVVNLTNSVTFNPSKGTLKTKILDKSGKERTVSPEEMYDMAIAFPDQYNEKGKFKYDKVRVTYRGKIREVPPKEVEGRLVSDEQMYGLNSSLIPFLGSDSGNRALMASAMMEQAVSLKDREIPIIDTSVDGKPGTVVAADKFLTKSPVSGTVASVSDTKIVITGDTGKQYEVSVYKNFPISNDSFIHETPIVKAGDKVKAGQRLAENNFTKDGHLALGKNLRIGYLPASGYTFEDGFVLTRQGADKLTSQHLYRFDIPKEDTYVFKKDSFIAKYPGKFKQEDIKNLDSKGIIRQGVTILPGQPIATYLKKSTSEELARVHKKFGDIYKKGLIEWDHRFPGEVVDVHEDDKKFAVFVRADAPAQVGDKLAGRHGNKGVVTRIIENSDAPRTEDGEALDIIISSAGIPSRMNAGQIHETALAKIMKHRGIETVQIPNFKMTNTAEDIAKELKKEGITGKEKLIDPSSGRALKNPVNVGYQYFLKLEQQADKKTQSRSIGGYDMDERPIRGKHGGGQSANRLFVNALLAHGAKENLYEMGHIKSQKNDEYWRAIKMGLPVPPPVQTPFAVKKFYDYLGGLGVTNKKEGSKIYLLPMTAADILKQSNGEIESGKFIRGKDGEPIVGGLFDPKVTGGPEGTKWAHITLAREIPNPVFEKAIINLTGLTEQKFEDALAHKLHYDPETGEWGDKKTKKTLTGVEALKTSLNSINLDEEIKRNLERSENINNPTDLNKTSRKLRYMKALKDNNLTTDVYFMKHVPVLPPNLRPLYQREGALIQSPLNKLYSNLALYNEKFKDITYDSKALSGRVYANLYGHVKGLYGLQDTTIQGRPFKGIIEQIKGDVPKYGFFQKKMVSKRQDLSARSVITLNTDLGPDQVGMPYNIAWEVYKPFVMRRMAQTGFSPLSAHDHIEKQTPIAEKFLQQEAAVRPVLMSRDPVLHKYNVLAFNPILMKGIKSIQLNALVTKGFNADFDGDSMLTLTRIKIDPEKYDWKNNLAFDPFSDMIKVSEGGSAMPFTNLPIRSTEGLVNLKNFPRIESTKVVTGNKEEYDVPPGVKVLVSKDGVTNWADVAKFSIHKDVSIVTVETNTARTLQATEDHSLITVNQELAYTPAPPIVGMTIPRLREIVQGGSVTSITLNTKSKSSIYRINPVVQLDCDFGYLTGIQIGDGWVNQNGTSNQDTVHLANVSETLEKNLRRILERYLQPVGTNKVHIGRIDMPHTYKGHECFSRKLTWSSPEFADFFRTAIGMGAHHKHLPVFWMHSPVEYRRGLLAGIIDTDGTVSTNKSTKRSSTQTHVSITTVSQTLAFELVALAHSLNMTAAVTISNTPAGDPAYVVSYTQESILEMKRTLTLYCENKAEELKNFTPGETYDRNKYTPKLTNNRLEELRKAIGSPRIYNKITGALCVPEDQVEPIKKRKSLNVIVGRVQRDNTAITKNTALDIINVIPDFFKDGFWAKWKSMVEDESIEWELVTKITPVHEITEAYDLTIPPFYTMVTEAGFIVQDTMSLHVPISKAAIDEAKSIMPTNVLISQSDKKFTLKPEEDALMGLHYATRIDKTQPPIAEFKNRTDAITAMTNGSDFNADDIILVDGKRTTFGREVIKNVIPNVTLPEEGINKSNLNDLLKEINNNNKENYGKSVHFLTQFGNRVAYMHGFSVGPEDLVNIPKDDRRKLFADTLGKVRKMEDLAGGYLNKAQQKLKNQIMFDGANKTIDLLKSNVDPEKNSLMKMVTVGSKGKPEQVSQLLITPFAVGTMAGNATPYPIKKSYAEGLTSSDYWIAQYGARKGAVDSRLEVSEPGFMSKQLVNTSMGNVISMEDCKTKEGRKIPIDQKDIQDRFLAVDAGMVKAGTLLTDTNIQLLKRAGVKEVIVRSPIYCEALEGTCQKCHGLDVTGQLPKIGMNIGVIAATSMSEPLTQMAMNSRHTSGSQSGGASAYLGIPRIKQITQMPATMPGAAVIAMNSGTIDEISDAPAGGKYVSIDGQDHFIPAGVDIIKKIQERVEAGDKLTDGNIHPVQYQNAVNNIYKTRELLADQIDEAYSAVGNKMRKVIYETYVKSMTNMARIGSSTTPEVLPGTYTTIPKAKEAEKKYGVKWEPVLKGAMTLPTINPDFMSRMGFTHLKDSILDAANANEYTDTHSYDPIPAWVHSKEFGKGIAGRY